MVSRRSVECWKMPLARDTQQYTQYMWNEQVLRRNQQQKSKYTCSTYLLSSTSVSRLSRYWNSKKLTSTLSKWRKTLLNKTKCIELTMLWMDHSEPWLKMPCSWMCSRNSCTTNTSLQSLSWTSQKTMKSDMRVAYAFWPCLELIVFMNFFIFELCSISNASSNLPHW